MPLIQSYFKKKKKTDTTLKSFQWQKKKKKIIKLGCCLLSMANTIKMKCQDFNLCKFFQLNYL